MSRKTLGSVATVYIANFDSTVVAKVDTGAWSGALHCTDIHEKDGVLFFTPLGNGAIAQSTADYEKRQVRTASGHVDNRYIVPLTLKIEDDTYQAMVGLNDRSDMQREMLLGRKFLIENNILVDVTLTLDDDHEAEKYL
jgi:hypothetical protein